MLDLSSILSVKKDYSCKKAQCRDCPYYERPFVPSYISDKDIVIIGEAPGRTEIETGVPFTGESGKLLRKILTEVGFNSAKVTWLNVVKCNPPENEQPHKKAQELCTKMFLFKELEEVKPKLVVLAGATALTTFFPDESITNKAGNLLSSNQLTFLPVLHPAYCLRNPTSTPKLRKDLKRGYQYINGNLTSDKEWTLITNVPDLLKAKDVLLSTDLITFDLETNGMLDVFDKDLKIWTMGFGYAPKKAFCIPLDHPENVNIEFKEMCWKVTAEVLLSKCKKVAHNAIFDIKVCKQFGLTVNNFYADTMVMAFLLDENRYSIGLKELTSEYLEPYIYAWTKDLKKLALYNCEDCDNTLALYHLFLDKMKDLPQMQNLLLNILAPTQEVFVDMELTGVLIDQKVSSALSDKLNAKLNAIYETIAETVPESIGVKLSSPKQLGNLLFTTLKYPGGKLTESKKQFSTDDEALEKLSRSGYKLATYLLRIREYEKLLSTYVTKLPRIVEKDGRVHCNFNICGARTGRISSSGPNLQNVPRDKTVKQMFVAADGYELLQADFSQAELRIGCSIANEPNMIKAYQNDQDIHKLTASVVLGVPISEVSKEDRQKSKAVNFGFFYGATAEGFQMTAENDYNVKLPLTKCVEIRKYYFNAYAGLITWYDKVREEIRKTGSVQYPTGRFRRFPSVLGQKVVPDDVFRKGVNSPVQGSASDVVLFTLSCLHRSIKKFKIPAKLILTVHDSLVLEYQKQYREDLIEEIRQICSIDIPRQFTWLKVPMKFDFAVGPNWGELVELS